MLRLVRMTARVDAIDSPSPNFNDRAGPVSHIMLHYTGMETGAAALARLCDAEAKVSAHYMVEEDGRIFRLVSDDKRAWHAGKGCWAGITDMNSASIGIEIVNGGHDFGLPDFPDVQIEAVIALVREILARHAIPAKNVIGHSDFAPDRKQDPGEKFPWKRLADAGCAIWPEGSGDVSPDPAADLDAIGYDTGLPLADAVSAFQRRFRPSRVDGQVDEETARLVHAVAVLSR
ncbi:N-acetylmuramoyl-L-alanine amidase [Hyphobacterium marinum]|uniref:N-acetylmuramoyl-L-alanine amidase n=1 Tax=Hyphobacterium marinum TaxID=3116574 RepID=A0ABU7LX18_9PROT|nr:N-acetylmuramoyl-L-alanine amidase [Hyphobacterium sp. Y6023]MEE2566064.1 N-acetylmuramoyl-L-alanine amidase [Hyphobacterium sp. Y6023]